MVEKQRNQTLTRLFFCTCQPFNFKDYISIYLRCIQNQFIDNAAQSHAFVLLNLSFSFIGNLVIIWPKLYV